MTKYNKFKQFIKRNWNINKEIKKKQNRLLFVDRERFYPAFVMPLIAIAICKNKKISPVILSDLKESSEIKKIYKAHGFRTFFSGFIKKEDI